MFESQCEVPRDFYGFARDSDWQCVLGNDKIGPHSPGYDPFQQPSNRS